MPLPLTIWNQYTSRPTLRSTDGASTVEKTDLITIYTAQAANSQCTPLSGVAPVSVSCTDDSLDATSWSWTFGDGGTSSNDFHAGMNFAGVWKSPVVFLCQNNGYAISCPSSGQTASESYAIKGEAYGIPGVIVDGQDVEAVYDATHTAGWPDQPRAKPLTFPMTHPEKIDVLSDIDSLTMKVRFIPRSFLYRAIRKSFRILRKYGEKLIHVNK